MDRLKAISYGKINLMLNISGIREDGYHTIETVMQTVSLGDKIEIRLKKGEGIAIGCTLPYIPTDGRNIAHKAAQAFLDEVGETCRVEINIQKTIPVGGGMGGGSANAATVLNMLNAMMGGPVAEDRLDAIALGLGADVPFCLRRGTYLATGIGEILAPVTPMPRAPIVICKPQASVSSKGAYGMYDQYNNKINYDSAAMVEALSRGDIIEIGQAMGNSFEGPIGDKYPEILAIKEKMMTMGAVNAAMTGSGSVVFGLFEKEGRAHRVKQALREDGHRAYVVWPVNETE